MIPSVKFIRIIWDDLFVRTAIIVAFGATLFSLLILVISYSKLSPEIPLYYSLPWGEEQLAEKARLFLLPGLSILVLLINFLLITFFSEDRFLKRIIAITGVLVAFLGTFTLVRILELII